MRKVMDVGFRPDDRIGNYRVEQELGPTGAAVLVHAQHLVLPRRVIIKVVHAAFASVQTYVLQTLREACILEAIAHPGVPIVYESGVMRDRRPWFAFEVVTGPTLEEALARGALPAMEVAELLRDLSDILDHAHRRGVIHRGLRPERVVVTADRRYPLCIPDWSEAIAHDAASRGVVASGSGHYVAPELAETSDLDIDDRADMFALGVIGYRALTGALPFAAPGAPYVAAGVQRPDAPRELASLIDALLAFERFERPTALEARTRIDVLLGAMPELQELQRTAARGTAPSPVVAATVGPELAPAPAPRRTRRPRWTPEVHYVESTHVDLIIDDDLPKQ